MILLLAALAAQAPAHPAVTPPRGKVEAGRRQTPGRPARCTLQNGRTRWSGRCRVVFERGGTFTITPWTEREHLPGTLLAVSVGMVAPGRAEIRGLTSDGVNSRWGPAKRLKSDRACWGGDGYTVCAY